MSRPIYKKVLSLVPPTSNATANSPQLERFKKRVGPMLGKVPSSPIFSENEWLYGRIYYFNHDRGATARDIHNIIKPLFDALEKHAYKDDKQIKHFEGYRLDMEFNSTYFDVEFNLSAEPDLIQLVSDTGCLVEVGLAPAIPSDLIYVNWLQVED